MTHHGSRIQASADPGGEIAQLRRLLGLAGKMAGRSPQGDEALDEAARIGAAYADALPIAQHRFDALTAETSIWAEAGLKALVALQERQRPTRAAAVRLADALDEALARLGAVLG